MAGFAQMLGVGKAKAAEAEPMKLGGRSLLSQIPPIPPGSYTVPHGAGRVVRPWNLPSGNAATGDDILTAEQKLMKDWLAEGRAKENMLPLRGYK
jgi:hypothetical protein